MASGRNDKVWQSLNDEIRPKQSEQSMALGGLPLSATERLQENASGRRLKFESNLSVSEFLLVRKSGYEPVGQVMGSSVFHVGWLALPSYSSGEIVALTHALQESRLLAASRMQQEAKMLQADGVVGVRMDKHKYDWGRNLIEVTFIGTAVRTNAYDSRTLPFISTLSGQDLLALTAGGFRPVGLVGGSSVWYQVASYLTMAANNQGGYSNSARFINQELTDFTKGFDAARGLAQAAMQLECVLCRAEGVVNVRIEKEVFPCERKIPGQDQERTDLIVSFQVLGTAIAALGQSAVPVIDYGLLLS